MPDLSGKFAAAPSFNLRRTTVRSLTPAHPCGSLRSPSTGPYTFIVMALLILLISPLVILRTPTDIFPNVNIPVIAVLWNYSGLGAEDMERVPV
jgi:hypothetical protein